MLLEVGVGRCGIVVYVLYKSPVPLHDTHTHTHTHTRTHTQHTHTDRVGAKGQS